MGGPEKSEQRVRRRELSLPGWVAVRVVDGLNAAVYYALAALLALMCCLAFLQVLARLFFSHFGLNISVPWSEELGRSFMIWLIFLGAAYACRSANMVALSFISDALPTALQRVSDALAALICIAFYGLLVSVGLKATSFGWLEMSPVLQFPKAFVYMSMPIGAALMIVNSIALLVEREMFGRAYNRTASPEHQHSATGVDA